MSTILNCTNLLGDSLYLIKPVEQFIATYPNEVDAIVAGSGLAYELFANTFATVLPVVHTLDEALDYSPKALVLKLEAGKSGEVAFANSRLPGGKQLHISEGYAKLLGINLDGSIVPSKKWFRAQTAHLLAPTIVLSPFSRSCSVHTSGVRNKTIDDWKWEHIVRYLRKFELPFTVLCSPDDKLRCSLALDEYCTAASLYDLELILRSAAMYVGVDNGIGHIAATLDIPMISFWPKVSCIEFIAPAFGRRTGFLEMDPTRVAPIAMMTGFRKFTEMLMEGRYDRAQKT